MERFAQIEVRLIELGYGTIHKFFYEHPGEPYGVMLKRIGITIEGTNHFDISILDLKKAQLKDAEERGTTREYAKDTLTRSLLEHLGKGWNRGKNWDERRSKAYASWMTPPDAEHLCESVWSSLKLLNPPDGWRPSPTNDEIVERAFDQGWPPTSGTDNIRDGVD